MKQPIALIFARGGSKRLLRKNVLPFCGKPLVEWSIIQACCSHSIGCENTYLSTDDDEIQEIGEKHKINIIRRPDWPNPDEISGAKVVIHALREIQKTRDVDTYVGMMPTSPMRLPDDVDRGVARYMELSKKYLDCEEINWVVPQQEMYFFKFLDDERMIYWLFNKRGYFGFEGSVSHVYSIKDYINRYDGIPTDKGFDNSNDWMEPGKVGRVIYHIKGQWFQRFDIDNRDDFDLCEFLMEKYILKGRGESVYYEYRNRDK